MNKRLNWCFALASLFSLCSCSATYKTISVFGFDTVIEFTIYQKEGCSDLLKKEIKDLDSLFDGHKANDKNNNVYTINLTNDPVTVDDDLFNCVHLALQYKKMTNGYFNPLVGALSDDWKNSLSNKNILSNECIENHLSDIANSSLILDKDAKTIQRIGDAKLDLGAIGKGYLLSKVKNILDEHNITKYIFNAGSSSVLLGEKANDDKFNVGLKYLDKTYLILENTTVSTSAIYEQLTTIDNIDYSHIVNPFTGDAKAQYDFVLVEDPDPIKTDILSTAFMSMSVNEIRTYCNDIDKNIAVLVHNKDGNLFATDNIQLYRHEV